MPVLTVETTDITDMTAAGRAMSTAASAAAQTALLSGFVGAGASAAKGLVPSPGATAHTNVPRVLADTGSFVMHSGRVLGTSDVATNETTTSTTLGDLSTAQSVAFTLDETTTVICELTFNCFQNTVGANCRATIDIDGTDYNSTDFGAAAANNGVAGIVKKELSLAAGAHTVKAQYAAIGGGTANFRSRYLKVSVK